MHVIFRDKKRSPIMMLTGLIATSAFAETEETTETLAEEASMIVTAEQELKQQPGVSTITAEDNKKHRR